MPAPNGNLNAARNGHKLAVRRLVIGELPRPLLGAKREARAYRRALETAVLDAAGEITVMAAHHIDTAAAATAHAAICRWLLREKIATMTAAVGPPSVSIRSIVPPSTVRTLKFFGALVDSVTSVALMTIRTSRPIGPV